MQRPTPVQLRKLIGIANYQFGKDVGSVIFAKEIGIACSRRTGRIRYVYKNRKLVATLRPKDGYLALTTKGASLILSEIEDPPNLVVIQNDVEDFIKAGGDVFAKHIVRADENLRPAEEALVVDESGKLLAVGKAVMSGREMLCFKRGVAVRVRRGTDDTSKTSQIDL